MALTNSLLLQCHIIMWGSPVPPGDFHTSLEAGYDFLLSNTEILKIHIRVTPRPLYLRLEQSLAT
jgi:hypothetical protein